MQEPFITLPDQSAKSYKYITYGSITICAGVALYFLIDFIIECTKNP